MRPFYVYLPSNVNNNDPRYKKNTPSKFTTKLAHPVVLPSNWVVGVSQVSFVYSWENIPTPESIYVQSKDKQYGTQCVLPKGLYKTGEALADAVNECVAKQLNFEALDTKVPLVVETMPTIVYNPETRRSEFVEGTLNIKTDLSPTILEKVQVTIVILWPYLRAMLGCDASAFAVKSPDYLFGEISGVRCIHLYSDIVEASVIGDTRAKIIEILETPTIEKFGEPVVYRFDTPQYTPVAFREISEIEIEFRTDTGKPLLINYGKSIVILHFKPE